MFVAQWASAATVAGLRCDGWVNPLGVDSAPPRLSWQMQSGVRGARQTGYQILVASTPEGLARGRGDLWDSGKVDSPAQVNVPYGGPALSTAQAVFWAVRIWDERGEPSPWSFPASWTMGSVEAGGWKARWITDPEILAANRTRLGYSSTPTLDENELKWLQLDLGAVHDVEAVRLHAVTHTVAERLGFPARFKVELATQNDFSDAVMIADFTRTPYKNAWATRITLAANGTKARYVRVTATQLRSVLDDTPEALRLTAGASAIDRKVARLAFSQIEVTSGGRNVAVGATVMASDSLEDGTWGAIAVVDGLSVPGANPRASGTMLLRKEVNISPRLRRAIAFVCGLGHYNLSVNGQRVGDSRLSPGWTDYRKTCLYDTVDLTAQLRPGANALGMALAGGMYNVPAVPGRYTKFIGPPRPLVAGMQLRLEYEDGRVELVETDESWRAAAGPTTFAQVYGGEDYDARLEPPGWDRPGFDDRDWRPAVTAAGSGGALRGTSHAAPPMKSFETLAPRAIATIESDVRVYDLGQNASIVPRLRVRGSAGAVVKILPAELIATDGRADQVSVGGTAKNEVCWTYLLSGDEQGETWSPQFTYHGARYLEVRLSPGADGVLPKVDELVGLVVHSDSDPAGEFACSNDLFNRTYQMVRWAQRSNMAHVLTDCPHRERLGWLEQTHLNGPALRYEFDLARLFSKTFRDMADAQQVTGLVPAIAPEYVRFDGGFWDSPEWGSAIVLAAWQHWEWTADDRPLREHYGAMQRYVDYLGRKATGHILSHGLGDWYDLGPNAPGNAQLTPVALTATAIYCETVRTLAKIAAHLGRADDERAYRSLAEQIAQAFNQKFWNAESGVYSTGSQTSLALPLVLGLAPVERVASLREALVADVRAHANGLTSGDVGYRYLLLALAEAGRSDVIFDLNTQTDRPGYGYQLSHGATSLPESWTAERKSSQNHFMLGQINEWFYGWLAGLAPDPAAPGFKNSILRPQPVAGVDWARARHATPYGELAIHWRKDISTGASGPRAEVKEQGRAPRFLVHATVPANTEATLYLPCGDAASVFESGRPVAEAIGVAARGRENGCAVFLLKAGSYEFEVRM